MKICFFIVLCIRKKNVLKYNNTPAVIPMKFYLNRIFSKEDVNIAGLRAPASCIYKIL